MDNEDNLPEFGIKRENEERRDGGFAIVLDPETQLYAVGKDDNDGFLRFFGGGVDEKEDMQEGVLRELVEESGLNDFLYIENIGEAYAHFRNVHKNLNRFCKTTCFLVVLKSKNSIGAKMEEHEKFSLVWVRSEDIIDNWKNKRDVENQPDHWFYFFKKAVKRAKELGYDTITDIEDLTP